MGGTPKKITNAEVENAQDDEEKDTSSGANAEESSIDNTSPAKEDKENEPGEEAMGEEISNDGKDKLQDEEEKSQEKQDEEEKSQENEEEKSQDDTMETDGGEGEESNVQPGEGMVLFGTLFNYTGDKAEGSEEVDSPNKGDSESPEKADPVDDGSKVSENENKESEEEASTEERTE